MAAPKISRLAPGVRAHIEIAFDAMEGPKALADLIRTSGRKSEAIAAVAIDHHDVTNAVIEL